MTYGWRQKLRERFEGTAGYWERRYATGGSSGAGSVGEAAKAKANLVNAIVRGDGYTSVLDLGCGDGAVAAMLTGLRSYVGVDVSPTALRLARTALALRTLPPGPTYRLLTWDRFRRDQTTADLVISLEVVMHLVEDDLYRQYMAELFGRAHHGVLIQAPDGGGRWSGVHHIRYRDWRADVPAGWALAEQHPPAPGTVSPFYYFRSATAPPPNAP